MQANDEIRLRHMLDAARKALRVAQGRTRHDLDVDEGLDIAMRNRLVHVYFDINRDILWQTVQEDLPGLIVQIEELVPQE